MAGNGSLKFNYVILILILSFTGALCLDTRKVHIVYMGSLSQGEYSSSSDQHLSILQQVTDEESSAASHLVRSYKRSFNGFVANLSNKERRRLASMKEVVSIFPSATLRLQTTRSWDFMGFKETVKRSRTVESDTIIGVLDTGIWPESESFEDEGFGPPPKKWKGACAGGENFTCNNKIIGARYYSTARSARDEDGHGSHVASIAAGNPVRGVSFEGLAKGTARGAVPSARIAVYKVCSGNKCRNEDVLAAFDDAIADGVDILSVSLSTLTALEFFKDVIAIGAFHAMEKRVLTVQAAGDSIFRFPTSTAPWIISVGSSTIDRQLVDKLVLGGKETIPGRSINTFSLNGKEFPVVYATNVSQIGCKAMSDCACLNSSLVEGKIVVCEFYEDLVTAYNAGAVGAIFRPTDEVDDQSPMVLFPAICLNSSSFDVLNKYTSSTKNPQATIGTTAVIYDTSAPQVSKASPLGPSDRIRNMLKPDVIAPGVNILAAFSPVYPPSGFILDNRRGFKYSFLSGTSVACPHVAGAAAYVRSFHPDWSPSAIRSSIMTTALVMDATRNPIDELGYGAGHINPVEAINPGLVYETTKQDYIQMLCSIGYDEVELRKISRDNSTCNQDPAAQVAPENLNYPTMTYDVASQKTFNVTFHRTVTNVGVANSIYVARFGTRSKLQYKVVPEVLSFKSINEKQSFTVTVVGKSSDIVNLTVFESLVWFDGTHKVRSPILLYSISY